MAMDNAALLLKVKEGIGVSGEYMDKTLLPKVLGVKGYMLNAGITEAFIESDTGIIALTIGVNDIWNGDSSSTNFSSAFNNLVIQLQAMSLPEEDES